LRPKIVRPQKITLIIEDIGQISTDNYEQVPDAASNHELSHSLGRKRKFDFLKFHDPERLLSMKADIREVT